jgi:hypothetical protein
LSVELYLPQLLLRRETQRFIGQARLSQPVLQVHPAKHVGQLKLQEHIDVCFHSAAHSWAQDYSQEDWWWSYLFIRWVIVCLFSCWIMEISRKKSYYACKTCKKPT